MAKIGKQGNYQRTKKKVLDKKKEIRKDYISKDFTAKEVSKKYRIPFSNNLQKILYRLFGSKTDQWGGARKGAGNKKGIKWCDKCQKAVKNCICD